jgi:hypothetical protein
LAKPTSFSASTNQNGGNQVYPIWKKKGKTLHHVDFAGDCEKTCAPVIGCSFSRYLPRLTVMRHLLHQKIWSSRSVWVDFEYDKTFLKSMISDFFHFVLSALIVGENQF